MKKFYLTLLSLSCAFFSHAQVVVMTPNNSGGFENGGTFAANSWTEVNGAFNRWFVGTGSVNVGARGAYIGDATTFVGTNNFAINHFYRNTFNLPAGATNALLTFRYRQPVVDAGFDSLIVAIGASTNPVPVAGATISPAYTRLYSNTSVAYPGYVQIGPIDIASFANNNLRLIFTHVNDGSNPIGIPAIDSVSLTYCPAITGTMVMCVGNSVNLACANTVTPTWSISGGATIGASTSTTATINGGATAGTAIITHTGGTCTVTATVTINPIPTAITGSLSVCAGNTTTLSSTPSGGTWSTTSPAIATVSGGTVTGVAAGTTNVTYMFQPTCRAIANVTVNSLPATQNVTGGGSFCPGGTGVPIGLDGSASGIDYNLYNGATLVATTVGTGGSISFGSFTTASTYTAVASDPSTSCTRNMIGSATVTITSPVTPSVSISSSPTGTICAGTAVTYTATPTNEGVTPSYNWYVNGALMGSGVSYTYAPANGDIISTTLYPGGICVAPDTATASNTAIITPMAAPGLTISVSPGNPSCDGRPVTFSATPVLGGTSPAYRWTKNGINVATGPTYTYTPANGDVVYCLLTSNYQCRNVDTALSSNITMTTIPTAPVPVVNITAAPGTLIDPGTLVTLTATYTAGTSMVDYQWHVNGTAISGATDNTYSSNAFVNGDIVTCKVTNTDPCANFTLKSIVINTTSTGLGTIDLSNNIAVVPNPNKGTFTLMGSVIANAASIKVTNLIGQTVYTNNVQVSGNMLHETLHLTDLAPGLYILNIHTETGTQSLHFTIAE